MRIKVKVIPSASREEILQCNDGLKIYVNQPAQDGRANKELIEILADYFHTKKYNITIIQGIKTRNKLVEIRDSKAVSSFVGACPCACPNINTGQSQR